MTLTNENFDLAGELRHYRGEGFPSQPKLLTLDEAAARLRISKWMLHRLINRQMLDSIKIGRRRLIPVDAVQALVDRLRASLEAL